MLKINTLHSADQKYKELLPVRNIIHDITSVIQLSQKIIKYCNIHNKCEDFFPISINIAEI